MQGWTVLWKAPHAIYYGVITALLSAKENMTQDLHGSCRACVLAECTDYGGFVTVNKRTHVWEIEHWGKFDWVGWTDRKRCLPSHLYPSYCCECAPAASALGNQRHVTHNTHTLPSPLIAACAATFDILNRRTFTLRCTGVQDHVSSCWKRHVQQSTKVNIYTGANFHTSRSRFEACRTSLCGRWNSQNHARPCHRACFFEAARESVKFGKVVGYIADGCLAA